MAKKSTAVGKEIHIRTPKKTSQDIRCPKLSSMNKRKRSSFKKYRGQGRP
jgi:hypothetical protein